MQEVDVAIAGSGFSGLAAAIRLGQEGFTDYAVLERADDVGGTWRDNTYPGCQCDVPSHLYSLSFAPNPRWTRTFSPQPEIQDYLRDCAARFGVTTRLRLGHELTDAAWDDSAARWRIETTAGELAARVLVLGMGPFSTPAIPRFPGLETFAGKTFHSGAWDHDHDLTGERVAAIGTGSSAIQFVPRIQPQVAQLYVYQRSAPWILPDTDRPLTRFEKRLYSAFPRVQRLVRDALYWSRESYVLGFAKDQRMMRPAEAIAMLHLRHQVKDRELRRKLRPDYRMGCKRVIISSDFYPALTQANVELVVDGIEEIRPHSIVSSGGVEREVDTIVFGTGFHVTDPPWARLVRGRDGASLEEVWQGSPQAYLGTTVAGFPNLFLLIGPNTGLGHTSMTVMIEAQVEYVLDTLRYMHERGFEAVEVLPEAQAEFVREMERKLPGTVFASGCRSWYVDSTGRASIAWPDFSWRFARRTRRFQPQAYRLRARTPAPAAVA